MKKQTTQYKPGTRAILATHQTDFSHVRPHVAPIFQTANFEYIDADDGLAVFDHKKPGYIYTRYSNPTTDLFGRAVADLEEAEGFVTAASGMAAISGVLLTLLKPGDHLLASANIYGGSRSFMSQQLSGLGIETTFVDIANLSEVQAAIKPRTRMLFTEVLGNPNLDIADIPALAEIAAEKEILLVVDNTFTPPPIFQPLRHGAHISIHSATKYLGGHGDLIGGVLVGSAAYCQQVAKTVQTFGGCMNPFNAWLAIRGVKTLVLRLERQCANAETIAHFLQTHASVKKVNYPGLADHSQALIARRLLNGFGSMLSFAVTGGLAAAKKIIDAVRVFHFTVSLGEIDSLIIHPASTSHVGLSREERTALGITDGLLRLSIGIEDIDDLLEDLQQALDGLQQG